MLVLLFGALWFYSTRRFVLCLILCYFVLVFFSRFCIAITSLGKERANLSAFRTFVRFALVWFCLFSLPLRVWGGLRLVIVALPGVFSYLLFYLMEIDTLSEKLTMSQLVCFPSEDMIFKKRKDLLSVFSRDGVYR